ncbi:hypothetical protein CC2G_014804 [Coprinopsis cinerea AmutBmut pab1-1]|nr:hypothetical protein CC2G_014804 [Coprinopsis cinerea AmutBmut pab1-1]
MPFQYPYSHSTYFTRADSHDRTSELPPMNSTEDVAQIRFMHDRMMTQWDEDDSENLEAVGNTTGFKTAVLPDAWNAFSRMTKDLKKSFRLSIQIVGRQRQEKKNRLSIISTRSSSKADTRSILG